MKKFIVLLFVICLCLSLCACKSKEAKAVDERILAIGDVTLEKEIEIMAISRMYDNLTAEQKEEVEHYATLNMAISTVNSLKYSKAVSLFKAGEYVEAQRIFDTFDNYKESSKYSKHCDFLVYYKICYQSVVRDLKGQLKDPNSLQVHNVEATVVLKGSSVLLDFELDYSAANSFGGMVRNEYTAVRNVWSFSDRNEGEEFVQGLQSCINMYKHHYKMYD